MARSGRRIGRRLGSSSEVGRTWLTSVIGIGTKIECLWVRHTDVEGLVRVVEVAREGVFLVAEDCFVETSTCGDCQYVRHSVDLASRGRQYRCGRPIRRGRLWCCRHR